MSLGFSGISFLTKSMGMIFLTWLGVSVLELNFKIYVPILTFVWFFSHLAEAFVIQHYMEKNVPEWLQNLQRKLNRRDYVRTIYWIRNNSCGFIFHSKNVFR